MLELLVCGILRWLARNSLSYIPQLTKIIYSGDIYNVIWDSAAVDGCTREFPPADYPRVSPLDIGRDVRAEDMTDFFVDFMATDQ